jgi:hypothetical protein
MARLLGPRWWFNPSIGSCLVHELVGSAEENEGIGESVMKVTWTVVVHAVKELCRGSD